MSIADKLREIDEHVGRKTDDVVNKSSEGSRENAGGISNRPLSEERQRQQRVPPRGASKEDEGA